LAKYFVYAPVDYVMGYLRYGHFEGEIEIPDDKIDDEEYIISAIRDEGELIVDDWRVEDYGDIEISEVRKIDEE
jgi:hypothetical protein